MRVLHVVALAIGAVACNVNDDEFGANTTWTVLIYGHADHNLSPNLAEDLDEMKRAVLADNVNVLVFADWDASSGFPTGVQWLQLRGRQFDVVETAPEANLDDPSVLAAAVEHGFRIAPADRHALVLWNHGGAWEGGFGGDTQNGTVANPKSMSIPVVADAVHMGLGRAGIDRRLDVLSFDTCLLGGVESAAELVDVADLYIANAELDYGPGHDYAALLGYLTANPGARLDDLATTEASAYGAHHRGTLIDSSLHAHVALDLERMHDVMTRGADLVAAIDSPAAAIAMARATFASAPGYFNDNFSPEKTAGIGLRDIGQIANLLARAGVPSLETPAHELARSLDQLVIAGSQGELRRGVQIGLNVELTPAIEVTPQHLANYAQKAPAWNQATKWSSLIDVVSRFADDIAPHVTSGTPSSLNTIVFRVDDADLADVTFEVGIVDNAVEYDYGYYASAIIPAATLLQMEWTGAVWAMNTTNGFEAIYAAPWSLSYQPDGAPRPSIMFTPGIISGDEETVALLVFDAASGTAPLFTVPVPNTGLWATQAAATFRGRLFTPLLPVWQSDGSVNVVRLGSVAIDNVMTVQAASMPPGGYRMNLVAADLWGNTSFVPFDVAIGGSVARRSPSHGRSRRVPSSWLGPLVTASRTKTLNMSSIVQRDPTRL